MVDMAHVSSLADVLRAHRAYSRRTELGSALGDGYLYARNGTFRAIRDAVVTLGYSFTCDDFCHYKTFHLISLPAILSKKRIPYFDTASPLREIERRCPGEFSTGMPLRPQSNFVMHESCHAIAHASLPRAKTQNEVVLRAHMAESLANTMDLFAGLHIDGEVHRFLFNMNSYHPVEAKGGSMPILRAAVTATSPRTAMTVLYMSYLFSNFLVKEVDEAAFDYMAELVWGEGKHRSFNPKAKRALVRLFALGVNNLPPVFRTETAELYFRLTHRLRTSIYELTDFDFLELLTSQPKWATALHAMLDAFDTFGEST